MSKLIGLEHPRRLRLDVMSVDRRGTNLVHAIEQELAQLCADVAEEHTGKTGTLSVTFRVSDQGGGETVVKPQIKRTHPSVSFAQRAMRTNERGETCYQLDVDPGQLSFADLEGEGEASPSLDPVESTGNGTTG